MPNTAPEPPHMHSQAEFDAAVDHAVNKKMYDIQLTAAELAARWRVAEQTLTNARSRGDAHVPYIKLPNGGIRYRLSDVIAAEQRHLK